MHGTCLPLARKKDPPMPVTSLAMGLDVAGRVGKGPRFCAAAYLISTKLPLYSRSIGPYSVSHAL